MSFEISKDSSVRFVFSPESRVSKVSLAGSFNNWQPEAMRKQKNGQYVRVLKLTPGSYEYKFVVDGQWQHDPENDRCAQNEVGTLNSVVLVG